MLANAARRWPDKTVLVFGDRSLTFAQLDQRSSQVAHALEQRGVAAR
jgi:non-ribosomal peptide synthetase component F